MGEGAPLEQVWVADRGGSHDDGLRAGVERARHRLLGADAPRDLELDLPVLEHAADELGVAGRAARRVEIDHVHALRARRRETACYLEREIGRASCRER